MYLYTDADTKKIGVRDSQDDDLVVVEFDEDGKARVDQETGQFVAERVDGLRVEEETRSSDDTEE